MLKRGGRWGLSRCHTLECLAAGHEDEQDANTTPRSRSRARHCSLLHKGEYPARSVGWLHARTRSSVFASFVSAPVVSRLRAFAHPDAGQVGFLARARRAEVSGAVATMNLWEFLRMIVTRIRLRPRAMPHSDWPRSPRDTRRTRPKGRCDGVGVSAVRLCEDAVRQPNMPAASIRDQFTAHFWCPVPSTQKVYLGWPLMGAMHAESFASRDH